MADIVVPVTALYHVDDDGRLMTDVMTIRNVKSAVWVDGASLGGRPYPNRRRFTGPPRRQEYAILPQMPASTDLARHHSSASA